MMKGMATATGATFNLQLLYYRFISFSFDIATHATKLKIFHQLLTLIESIFLTGAS
jgi:hypothetical protein